MVELVLKDEMRLSWTPPAMSNRFCELIKSSLGIPKDRIYIGFDDVNASDWGWNGRTFG